MMKLHSLDRRGIAARIRGLLGTSGGDDYGFSARRLGVSEVALRMTVDELDPHPAYEVMLAVIRAYGVDPVWLVTGDYNPAAHRSTLDTSDEHRASAVLSDLLAADVRGMGDPNSGRLEA